MDSNQIPKYRVAVIFQQALVLNQLLIQFLFHFFNSLKLMMDFVDLLFSMTF